MNYCDQDGTCMCGHIADEQNCRFYQTANLCRIYPCCTWRTWFASCLCPEAKQAAKETARLARLAIREATK